MTWNRFWDALTLRRRLLFAAVINAVLFLSCVFIGGGYMGAWIYGLPVALLCTLGCKTSTGFKTFICLMWIVYVLGIAAYTAAFYQDMRNNHQKLMHRRAAVEPAMPVHLQVK